jgi:hypothetical protein
MSKSKVSLANLRQGAAIEAWDEAFSQVLENIVDPNTDAKKKRTINLKVGFVPDEERKAASIEIDVTTALAPQKGFGGTVNLLHTKKGIVGVEFDPHQPGLYDEPEEDNSNIINIEEKGTSNA